MRASPLNLMTLPSEGYLEVTAMVFSSRRLWKLGVNMYVHIYIYIYIYIHIVI